MVVTWYFGPVLMLDCTTYAELKNLLPICAGGPRGYRCGDVHKQHVNNAAMRIAVLAWRRYASSCGRVVGVFTLPDLEPPRCLCALSVEEGDPAQVVPASLLQF